MSTLGMTITVLATQLSEAVMKDEAPEEGGFDLSAGLFGRNVSDWIRATAKELNDRSLEIAKLNIQSAAVTHIGLCAHYNVYATSDLSDCSRCPSFREKTCPLRMMLASLNNPTAWETNTKCS